LMAKLSVV